MNDAVKALFDQAKVLLEFGDTPVEVFSKMTGSFDQVSQDEDRRKEFRTMLRDMLAYVWPEVRKKSIAARLNRRNP